MPGAKAIQQLSQGTQDRGSEEECTKGTGVAANAAKPARSGHDSGIFGDRCPPPSHPTQSDGFLVQYVTCRRYG
jgi:hypothetical protein